MKKYFAVTFVVSLLLVLNCVIKPGQKTSEPVPPYDLIKSNFQQSSQIILFRLDSVKIKERIYADDGKLGYVVFNFTGVVEKVYKGGLKKEQQIKYNLWAEYDSNWKKSWQNTKELLVFLNRDKKKNEFNVIEVGQFKRTDGLIKLIERIEKQGKGSEKNL